MSAAYLLVPVLHERFDVLLPPGVLPVKGQSAAGIGCEFDVVLCTVTIQALSYFTTSCVGTLAPDAQPPPCVHPARIALPAHPDMGDTDVIR